MSDTKGTIEMLNETMDEIAREVGEMNPDDPVRTERLKELCALSQLTKSLKAERDKMIGQRMDELAREILTVPRGHPRRARIVTQIFRLARCFRNDYKLIFQLIRLRDSADSS